MAVKQNNTEANDAPASAGNGTNTATGATTNNKPILGNVCDEGGGGVNNSNNCGDNDNMLRKAQTIVGENKILDKSSSKGATTIHKNDIKNILTIIRSIEQHEQPQSYNGQRMLMLYEHIIAELARTEMHQSTPEQLTRFKEDIAKIGAFLAKPNEKRILTYYLSIVYELITQSVCEEAPSCALAIVFQLFDSGSIIEAVHTLLQQDVTDGSIRKTVRLLCDWICVCNFCQNLNLWIMALLKGLHEQGKYQLLDKIGLDNIEKLFAVMIWPALRTKVAPIVFYMLSNTHGSPDIFYKILPKMSGVIRFLKQQSIGLDEISCETRTYLAQLLEITNALKQRVYNEEITDAIKTSPTPVYESSYNNYSSLTNKRNARVGLVNLGNTCYMNSVLQALAMTNDFSRRILLIENSSPLLVKVQQQIALMHHSMRSTLTPTRVLNATRPPGFTPGLQQDSSEFLGHLLDLLHEHEINSHRTDNSSTSIAGNVENDDLAASGVIPYNSRDRELVSSSSGSSSTTTTTTNSLAAPSRGTNTAISSTIDQTFAGKLCTTYRCLSCSWESRNEDTFRELQLSFPDDKDECSAANYSVQDLIEYYCSPERLDGENQYFCPRCKTLCDAERRIGLIQPPRNLILTLKQFKYDQKYHFRTKLMHKVFHDESLVVKVRATDSLQELSQVHYDLYAGVVHAGFSMDSGHYYTFAADQSKQWYKFNDSLVTNSQPADMHNLSSPNTPYILFYQMSGCSAESNAASSSTVTPLELPGPLSLDELPHPLREYVHQDNRSFVDEQKMQRYKRPAKNNKNRSYGDVTRGGGFDGDDEDDDDHLPPPTGGCGGNGLGMNVNRFVY